MPQPAVHPRINAADETISARGLTVRFLLTGNESNGSVAAFELFVAGSQQLPAPAHSHDHYEETIYGLEGILTWTVNGVQFDLSPGQMLCIPRGAVHRFDNNGTADAKVLCVLTPAAIGPTYFREVFALAAASTGGPPDRTKMLEIMRRHGLTPALPPER